MRTPSYSKIGLPALLAALILAASCSNDEQNKAIAIDDKSADVAQSSAQNDKANVVAFTEEDINKALAFPHRSEQVRARDVFRHPTETLMFYGLRPDMTVVEVSPGAGWYTDIIAPLLLDKGRLYTAGNALDVPGQPEYRYARQRKFNDRIAGNPVIYGAVKVSYLTPPTHTEIAPPASADLVLTFRNVHNWMRDDAQLYFDAMYAALKPGGTLGVVEHRAKPGAGYKQMMELGYVTEQQVIEYAIASGFELVDRSEINANPLDTADYPKGVWTLPPSFRLKDVDREKYIAIGESDRMTLKFKRPL